jgi:hypothetical protein
MRTTIDKAGRGGPPPKLVRVGRRLDPRPTAAATDLPDVDVAALIEDVRNRETR